MTAQNTRGAAHKDRPFRVGDWVVEPAAGRISRQGAFVKLEPMVMDVLVHLASRPAELVTRDELERDVWRGALVGYDSVTSTIIKLRKAFAFADDPRHPLTQITQKPFPRAAIA